MAEYEACAMGILAALEPKVKVVEVYGDLTLVINQLNQEWETRDEKLIPYFSYIKELSLQFDKITFHHVSRENNQLADVLATLSSIEYPLGISENEKRTLRWLTANLFLNGNILVKRNHDMVLLKRVDINKAKEIIQDVHGGSYGTHMNRHAVYRKILRTGYYLLTLEKYCFDYVKKCHKCQIYADNIHAPLIPLNPLQRLGRSQYEE
ncbi:uncharacterized protein [Cicer arietinum]|uniref:uncharacterized protein n=1 Tax=Cicer arietinum TaxID=3827 RepID=UPI00064125CD